LAAVAAATAAALGSAAAAPGVRLVSPPHGFHFWHGGERQTVWRNREGERGDRRRNRGDFLDALGGADESGSEEAGSALHVSTPVFVDVTFAPAADPAPVERASGPKIIEVGHSARPRGRLPLVIYGD
jgi:hypothetical protein